MKKNQLLTINNMCNNILFSPKRFCLMLLFVIYLKPQEIGMEWLQLGFWGCDEAKMKGLVLHVAWYNETGATNRMFVMCVGVWKYLICFENSTSTFLCISSQKSSNKKTYSSSKFFQEYVLSFELFWSLELSLALHNWGEGLFTWPSGEVLTSWTWVFLKFVFSIFTVIDISWFLACCSCPNKRVV